MDGTRGRCRGSRAAATAGAACLVALLVVLPASSSRCATHAGADPDFAAELLAACRARGLELAVCAEASSSSPISGEARAVVFVDTEDFDVVPARAPTEVRDPEREPVVIGDERGDPAMQSVELTEDGVRLDGRAVPDLETFHARLAADAFLFSAAPDLPFERVVARLDDLLVRGRVVYGGVAFPADEVAALEQALEALPAVDRGEVLIVTDRRAPWRRHVMVISALAARGIARIAFAAHDDERGLVRLVQDLPVDVHEEPR